MTEYLDFFRPARPNTTTPAIGNVNGSHGERLTARRRNCVPVPEFGPVVVIVIETVVADAPAAIDVGLKTQLMLVSVVSVGEKEQPNVTALEKVDADVGVARNVYARVVCPDKTVCEALPVLLKVKVGAVTVTIADVVVEEGSSLVSPA
jgi:hypothetical protein